LWRKENTHLTFVLLPLVTISINATADRRDRATLPERSMAEARQDGRGGYLLTLPRGVLNRLKAIRAPGESYSDVIIRIARGDGEGARR
jgi:hypothetical protein